jgi:putative lipoic acid-binding regulatory protein
MDEHTSIEFPYYYSLRVIGHSHEDFEQTIHAILHRHGTQFLDPEGAMRHSRQGNYFSITIRFMIENKAQLEAIYMDLKDSDHVLMVL